MFDILICYDCSVTDAEKRAVEQAVRDIRQVAGCNFVFLNGRNWPSDVYRDANDIMRRAMRNQRGQIDAGSVLTMLSECTARWSNSAAMVLFTGEDLAIKGMNWCFGAARRKAMVTVQSMLRYRDLPENIMADCVARTLRHELGHIFGCAADETRTNTEENCGTHCTNLGCSMRQTPDLPQLMHAAMTEDPHGFYCAQCMAELRGFQAKYGIAKPRKDAGKDIGKLQAPYGRRGARPRVYAKI